jgi:hypothetical protein
MMGLKKPVFKTHMIYRFQVSGFGCQCSRRIRSIKYDHSMQTKTPVTCILKSDSHKKETGTQGPEARDERPDT